MKDLRQTSEYADFMKRIGWIVDIVSGNYVYTKPFWIFGSYTKIQRPTKIIEIYKLNELFRNRKSRSVLIEPSDIEQEKYYLENGFKLAKSASLPSKTIQIDIKKTEKQLLNNMTSKTRYNIGLAKRKGNKVIHSSNIDKFIHLWEKESHLRNFIVKQAREIEQLFISFGDKSNVLLVENQGRLIAGLFLVSTNEISYYMYAVSSPEGKKLHAPTQLVWEAIKWAKKRNLKLFDFEGIYDERYPISSWKGFTKFKKSFGGEEFKWPRVLSKKILF